MSSEARSDAGGMASTSHWTGNEMQKRVSRRYRAERRFRMFGFAAIGVSVAFLAFLLFTMAWKGLGGFTQIRKVLAHARRESERKKINALVYVGDCMEEEIDHLAALAGELGILGVPVFMFQEGRDHKAETAFREIARLTKGAYCRFDAGSAAQLRELLRAVAAYAAGGRAALEDFGRRAGAGRLLLEQMKR